MIKTIRQMIVELLQQEQLSALDLSEKLGVKEKEIFEHLEHITRSLRPTKRLVVESSQCKNVAFSLKKGTALNLPLNAPGAKVN